ncbi:MAG: MopE-related protein [Myxococcota bacterium]
MKRIWAVLLLACSGSGGAMVDAGGDAHTDIEVDAGPSMCTADFECQDGIFCNGRELCRPSAAIADARGCAPATEDPCLMGQTCNDTEGRCITDCGMSSDADRDGEPSIDCGGADCNDADPRTFPGNTEICDLDAHDEDCDPTTFGVRDQDMDGFPDALCCNIDREGTPICGTDCDDTIRIVHPTEAESCDGLDNDCDDIVDEGAMRTFWPDLDGDDFGDATADPVMSCMPPAHHVENDGDCDDAEPTRNPSAPEVCDSVPDNDCNPATNPHDADGDGFDDEDCGGNDCRDDDAEISPAAPQICDLIDNSCDASGGRRSEEDADDDGHASGEVCTGGPIPTDDCDDDAYYVRPSGVEHCNGIDDDCDAGTGEPSDCRDPVVEDAFVVYSSSSFRARPHDVVVDAAGNIYLAARVDAGDEISGVVAPAESIYVVSYSREGVLRWRRRIATGFTSLNRQRLILTTAGELNYLASYTGTLTAGSDTLMSRDVDVVAIQINSSNGAIVDAHSLGSVERDTLCGAVAAPEGGLYVCVVSVDSTTLSLPVGSISKTEDAVILRLRPTTLSAMWSWDFGGTETSGFFAPALIATAGRVYVHASSSELTALNADGTERWTVPAGRSPDSLAVATDGSIYVGASGEVQRYDPTGAEIWRGLRVGTREVEASAELVVPVPTSSFSDSEFPDSSFGVRDGEQPSLLRFGDDGGLRGIQTINEGNSARIFIWATYIEGDVVHLFIDADAGEFDYAGLDVNLTARSTGIYLRMRL